jgi:glycosyltransferase involved in cell wall biosynthesis
VAHDAFPTVLFLHPSDELYGADRQLLALVRTALNVARVVVVLPDDQVWSGRLSSELRELGARVVSGPLPVMRRSYLRPIALLTWLPRALGGTGWTLRVLHSAQPDLVVTNTTALPIGPIAAAVLRRRHLWWVRELVEAPGWYRWLIRSAAWLGRGRVVAISAAVARWLGPLGSSGPTVLHDSVPAAERVAGLGETPRAVFVGRLNGWKGWQQFVVAAAEVHTRQPDSRFVLIGGTVPGDEATRSAVSTALAAMDASGSWIQWIGEVPDVRPLVRDAWVIVAPSQRPEPLGNVVLEAMAEGRAAIGTAIGGIPELIMDGVTGVLVQPGDPGELSRAIERVLGDRDLAVEMGRAGAERYGTAFSPDAFDAAWLAMLHELLPGRR